MQVYAPPEWTRIRSYALPDYYLRADDSYAKLSPIPFDPYTSMLWKAIPGLASPDGVSFESLHQPDCFLRCTQFVLRLSGREDSVAFREECTFLHSKGLSDPSWSSFRSYLYPDLFIAVDGAHLRITAIEYEADKPLATFQLAY